MVAVKPFEVERFLSVPPPTVRLFLVYGSDPGAITERARLLERMALKRGAGDAVKRFGSDEIASDPGRITDETASSSLFGGEPVIALRVLDGRHNVIGAVRPILEREPKAAWVVLEAGELAPASPLRKAFEACPHAAALPTYPLEGRALSAFIRAAAQEAGLTVEPAALELLTENLAGDRLASRAELEKLFLYVSDAGTVTVEDVEAIVGDTTATRTEHLIDAALLGDSETLETGFQRMCAEGGSPAALAALALRHLILAQSLSVAVNDGTEASAAVERAKPPIFQRRRSTIEEQVRRWPIAALVEARRRVDRAVALSRMHPALEFAAISEALHQIALTARRRRRGAVV